MPILPSRECRNLVCGIAGALGIPCDLAYALTRQESGCNTDARSPKNARGLWQVTPAAAEEVGIPASSLFDPVANVTAGARYLRKQFEKFGSWRLALAAYNAGPGAVERYGNKIPPFRETINYIKSILAKIGRDPDSGAPSLGQPKTSTPQAPLATDAPKLQMSTVSIVILATAFLIVIYAITLRSQ